ncbi:MAG: thermonuclease family protein [Deltaproteobacteria bacterium]|nr:thermonuclease family protein [Deltaproteobacteria bacterium]
MTTALKNNTEYVRLCEDLKSLIEKGRQRAIQAVNEVFVETNWQMGKRLGRVEEIQDRTSSAVFVRRLARDLDIDSSTIYRALQFYRTWPAGLPDDPDFLGLGWGTHIVLMPLKDPQARTFYMKKAAEENWSRADLRYAIRNDLYATRKTQKEIKGKALARPVSGLHTYVAILERVIDGDTLLVRVDLGFDVWRVERIRLRGIDTPELKASAGRKAKQFVEQVLSEIPFLVLRTHKTDRYARYVADVFYDKSLKKKSLVFEKGTFLNQELIESGHARRVV